MSRDTTLEVILVVLLGVTALMTAWASWIGALHNGNQTTNYTRSNNLAAEGNSEYNVGVQSLMRDMMLYNEINNLMIDLHFAETRSDTNETEKIQWKIDELTKTNMSEEFKDAFEWAKTETEARGESVSPFAKEGFMDTYFELAQDLITQSEKAHEQGKKDNANGGAFGFVTVIYSVVLFLLGITGTFKNDKSKMALVIISSCAFVIATVYMLTIPLPTGFSMLRYFGGS